MSYSMTGYGKAEVVLQQGTIFIELHSVNRKFLEIANYLPKEFSSLDMEIRKEIKKHCSRGLVNVRLQFLETKQEFFYDTSLVKNCYKKLCSLAKELGFSKESISFPFLLESCRMSPMLKSQEKALVFKGLKEALADWKKMKRSEGSVLIADIKKRTALLEKWMGEIQKLSKSIFPQKRKELIEKFTSVFAMDASLETKVVQEAFAHIEKMDITEEIVRFKSHIAQMKSLFGREEAMGKKMEFILQEMQREINTISSKSSSADISKRVIDIKSELEKIKEQIQNIE